MMLDPNEYELTFESKGITYLFEDFVFLYYMPHGNVEFSVDGILRTYARHEVIAEFEAAGLALHPDEVRQAGARLLASCDDALERYKEGKTLGAISEAEFQDIASCIGNIFQTYLYFDPFYWNAAYLAQDRDAHAKANVEIVESIKNVAREKINTLCFGADSLLVRTCARIAGQSGISVADLEWYGVDEINAVFDGKRVAEDEITRRRACFLFLLTMHGERMRFSGEEAYVRAQPFLAHTPPPTEEFHGKVARKGPVIRGVVAVITRDYGEEDTMLAQMECMRKGDILVSETTDPAFMPAFEKASAVVTDLGGLLSHAAITAREMGIPCVVDTKNASKILKTGDVIEVDAQTGTITRISKVHAA